LLENTPVESISHTLKNEDKFCVWENNVGTARLPLKCAIFC
jgi:hypothetical protein